MNEQERTRLEEAIRRIDAANSHDPNIVEWDGKEYPQELLYAQWLTGWVLKLEPNASEPLRIAARSQHICRWEIPRSTYPIDRAGYLRWRSELKKLHASKTEAILREIGYSEEVIEKVRALNLKKDFPADRETQVLEDGLCLVFLERQFEALADKTSKEKLVNAVQKAWKKMTPTAHAYALQLPYPEHLREVIKEALGTSETTG